jgi:hypothetical protein
MTVGRPEDPKREGERASQFKDVVRSLGGRQQEFYKRRSGRGWIAISGRVIGRVPGVARTEVARLRRCSVTRNIVHPGRAGSGGPGIR